MESRTPPPYATDDRQRHFRRAGLRAMAVFGPLAAAVAALAAVGARWLEGGPLDFLAGPWLPYVAGLPAIPFLAGLAVYVTGRPFRELAAAWDELQGWQRGVLGLLIVLVAAAVIVGGVGIVLARLTAGR
jgi:hypothetical protein